MHLLLWIFRLFFVLWGVPFHVSLSYQHIVCLHPWIQHLFTKGLLIFSITSVTLQSSHFSTNPVAVSTMAPISTSNSNNGVILISGASGYNSNAQCNITCLILVVTLVGLFGLLVFIGICIYMWWGFRPEKPASPTYKPRKSRLWISKNFGKNSAGRNGAPYLESMEESHLRWDVAEGRGQIRTSHCGPVLELPVLVMGRERRHSRSWGVIRSSTWVLLPLG